MSGVGRIAPVRAGLIVLLSAMLVALGVTLPAAAEPLPVGPAGITVTANASSALAGGKGSISFSATSPEGIDLYNAVATAVLPVGVTYVPNSVSPEQLGEPEIRTWIPDPTSPDPAHPAKAQLLVWSNVSDLPLGAELDASFQVEVDKDKFPSGSTLKIGVGVYASSNERELPHITIPSSGVPTVDATEGGSIAATMNVVPITVTKAETANDEDEVYRGPKNPATFTLTVQAAPQWGTENVEVVDDVPASFTVTSCSDNCTRETVRIDGTTVTRLTWELRKVGAGAKRVLTYSAFVDKHEVTAPDGDPTGPATRPTAPEGYTVTNKATLTGIYLGEVANGASHRVSTTDDKTVRILDLGVVKSAASTAFMGGQETQFTLKVRTSQFIEKTTGITLTDVFPNGLCPVLPSGVILAGDPWPAECADAAKGTGTITGATMTKVTFDQSTGSFTAELELADLDTDGDATVSYSAYMRHNHQNGDPTTVGDRFTNKVTIAGTTTDATHRRSATNDSSATLSTQGVQLTKQIWPNKQRTPIAAVSGGTGTCEQGAYSDGSTAQAEYQLGDLVCFRISATFPDGVSTRSAVVSDFLPPGMELVSWAKASGNTTPITAVGPTRWELGEGTDTLYVRPGAKFSINILARVTSVPETEPEVTGNLAKMRYATDSGTVGLRDAADLTIVPPPPLALVKQVDGKDSLSPVQEGQTLTYTLDVTNTGTADEGNDDPIDQVEVWDVLPATLSCTDVVNSTPSWSNCAKQPDGTSLIKWNLDLSGKPIAGGDTARITYLLKVPTPLSISSEHTNTASVVRYTPISTDGAATAAQRPTFYPTNPLNAYQDKVKNASEASDAVTVTLGDAVVTKSVVSTGVTEPNNSSTTQATIGETVTWEYSTTIPAHTSIFNGILTENLPAAQLAPIAGKTPMLAASSPVPAVNGCSSAVDVFRLCTDSGSASFGSLFFPRAWTNSSDQPVTFSVTLPARVSDVAQNSHGASVANTVTLSSTPFRDDAGAVTRGSATATVDVVVAEPGLTKAAGLTENGPWVTDNSLALPGGSTVYYQLQATNANRPLLKGVTITDCIDSSLKRVHRVTDASVATMSGPSASGCPAGKVKYTWTLKQDLGANTTLVYSADIPTPVVSGTTMTNDATLTGTTLAGDVAGERTLHATAQQKVTAALPTVTKARTSPVGSVVPGESVTWRITVAIPAGIELPTARILDTLGTALGTAADASFQLSCDSSWGSSCPAATPLGSPANSPQVLGLFLGDIAGASIERTLYVDVTSTVPNTVDATVLGAENAAALSWEPEATVPPSTAVSGSITTPTATALVDLRHPAVVTTKKVSDAADAKEQGEIFTYTVGVSAVQNSTTNGKSAYHVQVQDTVPAGVIPVQGPSDATPLRDGDLVMDGGVWDESTRTITWTIAELSPGVQPTSIDYYAKLDLASKLSTKPLVNSVVPQSWQSLPSGGKTYTSTSGASASVTPALPIIATTKRQLTANPVYIGHEVSYSLTLTNTGTASAVSLSAKDTLPPNWSYVQGSAQLSGTAIPDPTIAGQELSWRNLGPLAPEHSLTITYRARAAATVAVGSEVTHINTATAADVTDATGGTSMDGGKVSYVGDPGTAAARIDQADLKIEKTAGTFTAGGAGTFTLEVTNLGGDPAVGIAVSDALSHLPTGITLTGTTASTGSCAGTPTAIGCTLDTLPAGSSWTITSTFAVDANVPAGTQFPNTATVSARTEDRFPANNTASATASVVTSADLQLAKTTTRPLSGPVIAGNPIVWAVTLINAGPSVSRGSAVAPIVLTDKLPSGVTNLALIGAVPAGCGLSGRDLRCEITHDLAVGDSVIITVSGTVEPSLAADTVIANSVAVTPATGDPDTSNNTASVSTPVAVHEGLSINKSIIDPAPPEDVTPGDPVRYRLDVTNSGPSDARGVFVTDTLPTDLTFQGIDSSSKGWNATRNGNIVTFEYAGTLPAGQAAPPLTYTTLLDPGFTGTSDQLLNTASVSSAWKRDQGRSTAVPAEVEPEADLMLTKTVAPKNGSVGDPLIAGEKADYTFTVTNLGPSHASKIIVTDTLPRALSLVGTLPQECKAAERELTCTLDAGLHASGTPWAFTVTTLVDPAFTGSSLVNSAKVDSVTNDPDMSNNRSTATAPVLQRADLQVEKTPARASSLAGTKTTWTITVRNTGASDAQNVVLDDVIDHRLSVVSATTATGTCTTAVTCVIGTVPSGGRAIVTVETGISPDVPAGSVISNSATVHSTTPDATGKPAKATGSGQIAITAHSELKIVKSTTTPKVRAGEEAVFQMDVTNDGPSDALEPVVVTDTLPAGLRLVWASTIGGPSLWDCKASGQDVACELRTHKGGTATLAAGAQAPTLQLVAAVDPSHPAGKVTNTATVTTATDDQSHKSSVDVDVSTFADLGIKKTSAGAPVAGRDFTWTLSVKNHGPSDSDASPSHPIVVTDVLPLGVTFSQATGDATCSAAPEDSRDKVTCLITKPLTTGETAAIAIEVAVSPGAKGALANLAEVTPGRTAEPVGAIYSNSAVDITPLIIEQADLRLSKRVLTPAAEVVAGEPIAWELAISNAGPADSEADKDRPIVVTDVLPAGASAVSVDTPSDDWECTISPDRGRVVCHLSATLNTGETQRLRLHGVLGPDTTGTIRNNAQVEPGLTAQPPKSEHNDIAHADSGVDTSADLRLHKDVSGSLTAGLTGNYLLQVYNDGPSAAHGLTIVDDLPAGLTFVDVAHAQGEVPAWECATAPSDGQRVKCTYGEDLKPGRFPVSLSLVVAVSEHISGDVTNTASVTSHTTDPDVSNNTDSATGTLSTTADLSVVKTHRAGTTAVAGKDFTWLVTVTNEGPSDSRASAAEPITVTDRLAPGTTFTSAGSAPECSVATDDPQLVTCVLDRTMPPGNSAILPITVTLDQGLSGSLNNTAQATPGTTADPVFGNNTGNDNVAVVEQADLALTKELVTAPEDVIAGRNVTWTLQARNLGPSDSNAIADAPIRIIDTLPEGVTNVSATGDGWACAPGQPSGTRGTIECLRTTDLATGDAPAITIVGAISPDTQATITNEATITPGLTPEPGDSTTNNNSKVTTPVLEQADLVLSKAVSKTITAGADGQYVLQVTNLGPSSARGVTIVDTLPTGLAFAAASGSGWACSPGRDEAEKVTCDLDGTLPPSSTSTLLLDVTADQTLRGDLTNTAVASTTTPEVNLGDNTASVTGTIAELTDLAITKTAVGTPKVGGSLTYELSVYNAGPSLARGVLVTDLVPESLDVSSVSASQWHCGDAASKVTCTLPELAAGATAPVIKVKVHVLPGAYPSVSNTATVASATVESPDTLADNTSTAEVRVPSSSKLVITKTLNDSLITGKEAHYTLTTTNEGLTADPGPITVTDDLPEGLEGRKATLKGADGACDVKPDIVVCTVDGLEIGQTATIDLVTYVSPDAPSHIVNEATVHSDGSSAFLGTAVAKGDVKVVGLPTTGGGQGMGLATGLALLVGVVGFLGWRRRRKI